MQINLVSTNIEKRIPPNTFKSENFTKALVIFGNLKSKWPNIRMKIIPVSLSKLLSGRIDRLKFIPVQLDHSVVKAVGTVCTCGNVEFNSCYRIIAICYLLSVTCYLLIPICSLPCVTWLITRFIRSLLFCAKSCFLLLVIFFFFTAYQHIHPKKR